MARSRIPHAASSGFARIQWCSILGLVIGALLFTVLSSSILLTPDGEIALALRDANITTNLVTVQPPVLGVFDSQLDGSSEIYRAMPTKYMKVLLAFDNHSVPGREGTRYLTTEWVVCLVFALLVAVPSLILFVLSIFSPSSPAETPAHRRDVLFGSMAGLASGITSALIQLFSHHQGKLFIFEWYSYPAYVLWVMNAGIFLGLAYPKPPRHIDNGRELEFQTLHGNQLSNVASPAPVLLNNNSSV